MAAFCHAKKEVQEWNRRAECRGYGCNQQLMDIMGQQGMKEQSQDFLGVLNFVAGMQVQLSVMVDEVQGVREQLAEMQKNQPKAVTEKLMDKVSQL